MIYPNLSAYYVALGGESSRETIFGQASWDAVADPRGGFPLEVRYNHGNGDVLAIAVDGRVVNLGTVIADDYADTEEILSWFHEPDGSWPERSLQEAPRQSRCGQRPLRLPNVPAGSSLGGGGSGLCRLRRESAPCLLWHSSLRGLSLPEKGRTVESDQRTREAGRRGHGAPGSHNRTYVGQLRGCD